MKTNEEIVKKIIDDVKKNKDRAVVKYTKLFDKVLLGPSKFKVTKEEIGDALKLVDKEFIPVLRLAIKNIRDFHKKQKPKKWIKTSSGITSGLRYLPIDSVGIYVPGGRAAYPSSVIMNAIPAQIAGVKNIVMASPPQKDAKIHPYVLAAAYELGIDQIYKVGGAQAIAALAFGTENIPKVDKIVGPGNIYVTIAKKILYGEVGIDKLAGPSDVVIISDETANAEFIASDMMAQLEHDPLSKAILIATSKDIKEKVKIIIKKSGYINKCGFYSADNLEMAASISNIIAPEHLELHVKYNKEILKKIKNAGAIFLGPYSPVAIGDYLAGPNHVLPTLGSSRFSSPLGVYDFIKYQSIIGYSKKALKKISGSVKKFAYIEGLKNHAGSIDSRFK